MPEDDTVRIHGCEELVVGFHDVDDEGFGLFGAGVEVVG